MNTNVSIVSKDSSILKRGNNYECCLVAQTQYLIFCAGMETEVNRDGTNVQ